MRKTRYLKVQRTESLGKKWYARSVDVLDTSYRSPYVHVEDHITDSVGSQTGLIVGIVVGIFLGVFVLVLLYIRRRSNSQARDWRIPSFSQLGSKYSSICRKRRKGKPKPPCKFNAFDSRNPPSMREYQTVLTRPITSPRNTENIWPRLKRFSRRKSRGVQEITIINAPNRSFTLQPEQSSSPVPLFPQNTETSPSTIASDIEISAHNLKGRPELPRNNQVILPQSSWLLLSPNKSDEQTDVETVGRPGTARTSRVTIPSYYFYYYRKYFDRDNYRVQSQYYPESRLSTSRRSDMTSFKDPSEVLSTYQKRGTISNFRPLSSYTGKPLPRSYKDPLSPMSQDPNLAYFDFDVHVLQQPKQLIVPARRNRSMNMHDRLYYQREGKEKKTRHRTVSSIATVSTAPIFRQHPGEEVDLESMTRVGRARSSLLNGVIIHGK